MDKQSGENMEARHQRRYGSKRTGAPVEMLESRLLLTSVVVNSVSDAIGGGIITLRDAITQANKSTTPTTITFAPQTFSSPQTILLANGILELTNTKEPTKIVGPAAGVTISGNKVSGVFEIDGSVNLSLVNATVTGGTGLSFSAHASFGGGIYNSGSTTLSNVTVSGNSSMQGGGIFNEGSMFLTNVTLSGNTAFIGGGIECTRTMSLTGVTVSGNVATNAGGGITCSDGLITLTNVTVSGNSAPSYAGIQLDHGGTDDGGIVSLANSIVAGNKEGDKVTANSDFWGPANSFGHNLIGITDGSTGWNSSDLSQSGTAAHPVAPKLGPLAKNGGPTMTMVPLAGSPAIDAGSVALIPAGITTDQRGLARIYGSSVDIGAVEFQPTTITGTVFNDSVVKNGKQDAGEAGLAGWKVYDDVANKGSFVTTDPFTYTNATGGYTLAISGTGTAYIRQVLPANWTQTGPASNAADKITLVSGGALKSGNNIGDYTAVKYLSTVATTSGLVAWWTFDSSSQANSIINGYTGTLKGGAKLASASGAPISGETTSGLSLNGTSAYVDTNLTTQQTFATTHTKVVAGHAIFTTTAAATFNVWVNFGSTPIKSGHVYTILAKSQFGNDLDLQLESDGKIHFYTDNGSSAGFAPSSLTGWHMLTAEFDTVAATRELFWDGKLAVSTNPYTGNHTGSTNAFSIGESDIFTGRYCNGSIDEVSLWNRALSAAEILAIYNASK